MCIRDSYKSVNFTGIKFNFNKCCTDKIYKSSDVEVTLNLTLTSVVFESLYLAMQASTHINLTLTSVVFEYSFFYYFPSCLWLFNFNKCCI